MKPTPAASSSVPLVIQLGFAGARALFDRTAHPELDAQKFEDAVAVELVAILRSLPERLGLAADGPHFFCGISQIAIGGDTAFTRACEEVGFLQRIFLPQPLDSYLTAVGSAGPDFTPEQRRKAESLLESQHVIQTRVVSDSADRHERFGDVNLEIARVSDVVICVVRAEQNSKSGGTHELADFARKRQRPVILLEVGVGPDGSPVITCQDGCDVAFTAPVLPPALGEVHLPALSGSGLPSGRDYCDEIKKLASDRANSLRFYFKWAALIIVLGHVLATAFAVSALKLSGGLVFGVLAAELVLLGFGLLVHYMLHHSQSLARWAAFRLVAETARSVQAIGTFPIYLEHFFTLPFPPDFRALVRTINVLHLRDTAATGAADWAKQRDAYVRERLLGPVQNAQVPYNRNTIVWAERRLRLAQQVFYAASISALVSTLAKLATKLVTKVASLPVPEGFATGLGVAAILLPVVAVAALSLAAAFDLEARKHTSEEMVAFLERQAELLEGATSAREFAALLIETESRLLGETVNWYARRSFVGVA